MFFPGVDLHLVVDQHLGVAPKHPSCIFFGLSPLFEQYGKHPFAGRNTQQKHLGNGARPKSQLV